MRRESPEEGGDFEYDPHIPNPFGKGSERFWRRVAEIVVWTSTASAGTLATFPIVRILPQELPQVVPILLMTVGGLGGWAAGMAITRRMLR